MTRRLRVVGLPGLAAGVVAALGLSLVQRAGIEPRTAMLEWHHPLQFYVPWLLALPAIGAAAALWSRAATGTPREMLIAALSPALAELALLAVATVADLLVDVATGHHSVWHALCGTGSFSVSYALVPALALATGALPVVAIPRARANGVTREGRVVEPALLWCLVAAVALATARPLGHQLGLHSSPSRVWLALLLAWAGTLAVAALASWQLVRLAAYAPLLPLAALGFALVEPGRAGDPATWRLEWGVFGLLWTAVALVLFGRLLRRQDELERRTHLEGAALALALAVPAAAGYALFEPLLPALRAGWVASGLLVLWWLGWLLASRRYR